MAILLKIFMCSSFIWLFDCLLFLRVHVFIVAVDVIFAFCFYFVLFVCVFF